MSGTPYSHESNKTTNPPMDEVADHRGHSMSTNGGATFGPRKQQSFGENSAIGANLATDSRQITSNHDFPTTKVSNTSCSHMLDESMNTTMSGNECHSGQFTNTSGDNILGPQNRQDFGKNTKIGAISAKSGTRSRQIASFHGSPTTNQSGTPCSHKLDKSSNITTNGNECHGGHSHGTKGDNILGFQNRQDFGKNTEIGAIGAKFANDSKHIASNLTCIQHVMRHKSTPRPKPKLRRTRRMRRNPTRACVQSLDTTKFPGASHIGSPRIGDNFQAIIPTIRNHNITIRRSKRDIEDVPFHEDKRDDHKANVSKRDNVTSRETAMMTMTNEHNEWNYIRSDVPHSCEPEGENGIDKTYFRKALSEICINTHVNLSHTIVKTFNSIEDLYAIHPFCFDHGGIYPSSTIDDYARTAMIKFRNTLPHMTYIGRPLYELIDFIEHNPRKFGQSTIHEYFDHTENESTNETCAPTNHEGVASRHRRDKEIMKRKRKTPKRIHGSHCEGRGNLHA